MSIRFVITLIVVVLAVVEAVKAGCSCRRCPSCSSCDSSDLALGIPSYPAPAPEPCPCTSTSRPPPMVIRPHALPRPSLPLAFSLSTAPGPCFKRRAMVKPASIPKPQFTAPLTPPQASSDGQSLAEAAATLAAALSQSSMTSSSSSTTVTKQQFGSSGKQSADCTPLVIDTSSYNQPKNPAATPADAVSLALAFKQAQKQFTTQNEDMLSFGFRRLPIEPFKPSSKLLKKGDIPEENLYSLNGQIVELKPVADNQGNNMATLAEEAEETLLEHLIEEMEGENSQSECQEASYSKPTLQELGYAPAKISEKPFVDVPAADLESVAEEVGKEALERAETLLENEMFKKHFKSGSVVYQTVPANNEICKVQKSTMAVEGSESDSAEVKGHHQQQLTSGSGSSTYVKHSMTSNSCSSSSSSSSHKIEGYVRKC